MAKKLLPLAAMENILKHSGAQRVSESAKEALKAVLEEFAQEVSKDAIKYATHAGRVTVKAEDIQLAIK